MNIMDVAVEKQKGCEGCSIYPCLLYISAGLEKSDLVYRLTRIEECPCRICLVKSMCSSMCDNYAKQFKNKRILRNKKDYIRM